MKHLRIFANKPVCPYLQPCLKVVAIYRNSGTEAAAATRSHTLLLVTVTSKYS